MTPFVRDNLRSVLSGKKVLLGITGSIAAFKACDIIRFLRDCDAQVRVVLTKGAENFVTKTTMETLSGSPVLSGFWNPEETLQTHGTHHIDTARWADLILVAPATAHFIAKIAQGLADDLLSTEILAFRGPLFIAPAMNPAMFAHAAVQENMARLRSRGVLVLGPAVGTTSCGEEGLGRMIEPDEIVERLSYAFHGPARTKRMVITLGPTRSALDPVRYLTNRSSGLMGASLCWAAFQEGYSVTAVSGPIEAQLPRGIEVIRVQTAREMAQATLSSWSKADVFIGAAAVLDWDIKNPASFKLKKENGTPDLEFEKNIDILASVALEKKPSQFVLGFAAETHDPIPYGFQKLKQKNCNAVFVNDVSKAGQGFESNLNAGWWLAPPDHVIPLPMCPKTELARKLISLFPN